MSAPRSSCGTSLTLLQLSAQCMQAGVQSSPCLRHEHCEVRHPVLQPHRTTLSSSSGAGASSVIMGIIVFLYTFHPHSVALMFESCIQRCTCRYTLIKWNLAAADVGGKCCGSTYLFAWTALFWICRTWLRWGRYIFREHCTGWGGPSHLRLWLIGDQSQGGKTHLLLFWTLYHPICWWFGFYPGRILLTWCRSLRMHVQMEDTLFCHQAASLIQICSKFACL